MDAIRLNTFLTALAPMRHNPSSEKLTPANLRQLFGTLATLRAVSRPAAPSPPSATALMHAFAELKAPMAREKARGGLVNPWQVAGLKTDELRNAAALAGLWSEHFGGVTSRHFLASYLSCAHSDASGRLFRQHPVSHSGISGQLRIVAA